MEESKIKYASIVLSAIAIGVSIPTAITICYRWNERIDFDSSAFYGCLIAVLAILVTVLIGFQIMNYLSFEEKMKKEVDKAISIMDKRMDDKIKVYDNRMGATLSHTKANNIFREKPKDAIADYVKAIKYAFNSQMDTTSIIEDLSLCLNFANSLTFSAEEINTLTNILQQCNVDKKIIEKIKKLGEKKSENMHS